MALRQFTDPAGIEWSVYDVVPRQEERRQQDRRDTGQGEDTTLDRRMDDRRAGVSTSRPVRITRGWLCFESAEERRRLQPIPEKWPHMPEAELVELLQQARVAPRRDSADRPAGARRS